MRQQMDQCIATQYANGERQQRRDDALSVAGVITDQPRSYQCGGHGDRACGQRGGQPFNAL